MELSPKAQDALASLSTGPGWVSIKHAGALRSAGLIKKADGAPGSKPGYTWAQKV